MNTIITFCPPWQAWERNHPTSTSTLKVPLCLYNNRQQCLQLEFRLTLIRAWATSLGFLSPSCSTPPNHKGFAGSRRQGWIISSIGVQGLGVTRAEVVASRYLHLLWLGARDVGLELTSFPHSVTRPIPYAKVRARQAPGRIAVFANLCQDAEKGSENVSTQNLRLKKGHPLGVRRMEQTQVSIPVQPPPTATTTTTWIMTTNWNLSLTRTKQTAKGPVSLQHDPYVQLGDPVRLHHSDYSPPRLSHVMAQRRPLLKETRAHRRLCRQEPQAALHPQLYNSPIPPSKTSAVLQIGQRFRRKSSSTSAISVKTSRTTTTA